MDDGDELWSNSCENILVIYKIIKSHYFTFIKAYWKMLKSQMGY